jgi:hypothetical protein
VPNPTIGIATPRPRSTAGMSDIDQLSQGRRKEGNGA